MRIQLKTIVAPIFVAVAIAVLLAPQAEAQFQAPSNEELKMTDDRKAPGADAVYLYREEKTDDTIHYHSLYARMKVLTERGKELATVSIPYQTGSFTVEAVQGRTIHSDGTVVPLNVKPSDLVMHKDAEFQVNQMVFTLPSVEVGSILEYYLQLRYGEQWVSSPRWEVEQPYFVHKAHYSFTPYPTMADRLLLNTMLPPGVKVVEGGLNKFTLDVTDVAATPNEDYMPPLGSLRKQVEFYYTDLTSKDDYWKQAGDRWSKDMEHFAAQSKLLKDAASALVAPSDSEEVKARKIYDAVMALENTDFTRRKSSAELKQMHLKPTKVAEDVWKQKSGTSDEIALLYLAMVRSVGLKAYATTVCNRNRSTFNPYYLSIAQFDDILVLVTIDGKETPLDPGTRFAAFGQLHWKHTLTDSLRQTDKGTAISSTPGNSYKDAVTVRSAKLTIDPDGSVKGTARISMTGPEAIHWRELAIESDEDEVKKEFNEQLRQLIPDGVSAEIDHFEGLEDYHATLVGIVHISGSLGTGTSKRMFLPGLFFESRAKHPFVATEKRMTPVDMRYAENIRDEVTYHLPDTFAVESAPADTSIPWTGHAALGMKAVTKNNDITVARSLIRGFAVLQPVDYPALRDFYQKVATADQQQLVLTSTPAAKAASE